LAVSATNPSPKACNCWSKATGPGMDIGFSASAPERRTTSAWETFQGFAKLLMLRVVPPSNAKVV